MIIFTCDETLVFIFMKITAQYNRHDDYFTTLMSSLQTLHNLSVTIIACT